MSKIIRKIIFLLLVGGADRAALARVVVVAEVGGVAGRAGLALGAGALVFGAFFDSLLSTITESSSLAAVNNGRIRPTWCTLLNSDRFFLSRSVKSVTRPLDNCVKNKNKIKYPKQYSNDNVDQQNKNLIFS